MDIAAQNLIDALLLVDNSALEDDLETLLPLLSFNHIRNLCKDMNLSVSNAKQRQDYINAILVHSKKKSLFSQGSHCSLKNNIFKKALNLLGTCYRLSSEPRKIFLRIISLYSLADWWDDRENSQGGGAVPTTMTTILLQNTGRFIFPLYRISREIKIFQNREELLAFEYACTLEANFAEAYEEKDWDIAIKFGKDAGQMFFDNMLKNTELHERAVQLPKFLRKFTCGSILAYVLTQTVEVYEKLKDYEQAVSLLRRLINQDVYLSTYHGHWYERLCLDLDQHLKKPKLALQEACRGLKDPNVRVGRKLALCQRIEKICNAKSNSKIRKDFGEDALEAIILMYPKKYEEVVLQGRLMPKAPNANGVYSGGSTFVFGAKYENEQLLCSVEEFVKLSYRKEGFPHGIHAEGSVVNTIFTILFWDILYDEIPDVFRTPHQVTF